MKTNLDSIIKKYESIVDILQKVKTNKIKVDDIISNMAEYPDEIVMALIEGGYF